MNDTITTPSFLENLRRKTAQSHNNLEELPISKSIMNPLVTKADYALYLDVMHDVVKDVEENIFPALNGIITDLSARTKHQLLENDLKVLGHSKNSTHVKPLSNGIDNPSAAFALGILYVLEGSTLGGRILLKNINTALGYDIANGATYFAGYGSQTGSQWKNFLAMLTEYENQNNNADEIIAGADYCYNAISAYFTKNASK